MPKYESLDEYVATFNPPALRCYRELQSLMASLSVDVKERLFAGAVTFYDEATLQHTFHSSPIIMLAFFADHVNVFALKNNAYNDRLPQYKFTAKGTMQIPYDVPLETELLRSLFSESLK